MSEVWKRGLFCHFLKCISCSRKYILLYGRCSTTNLSFRHSIRKVPTARPAVQAQSSYFRLTMMKKSIRSTGVKLASPHLVFATLSFGSGGNSDDMWTVKVHIYILQTTRKPRSAILGFFFADCAGFAHICTIWTTPHLYS